MVPGAGFVKKFDLEREELAVLVSGIVSMGLEILAGRVLAPRFGSTIYTWGTIIGVSMLALSLGYLHGGRTSSKADYGDLEKFLMYTTAYIFFVIIAGDFLLSVSSGTPLPTRYAAVLPVTILFGPPTYFLGYISPYGAELSSKSGKGEASGHFYALGTAGSILGAFGTTFVLVPFLSTDQIYLFFAVLSTVPLVKMRKTGFLAPLFVVLIGVLMVQNPVAPGNTVYTDSTVYQELRISDSQGVRTLYLDGQPQSAIYLNGSGYPWGYLDYFHLPLVMRDDVENVLFIGGGGFVGPQEFARMGYEVDAVEIDPGVVKAARKYFNLSENNNLSVHTQDGRKFLQNTNRTYDVIYLDAYRKSQVPFHLTTKEFMQLAYNRTDENGIVMSNIISTSSGPGSKFARSEYRTMNSVFESVYFFPTQNTNLAQNIELLASKNPGKNREQLYQAAENYTRKDLSQEISMMQNFSAGNAEVLRDDYAPVERLLNPLIGKDYVVD